MDFCFLTIKVLINKKGISQLPKGIYFLKEKKENKWYKVIKLF